MAQSKEFGIEVPGGDAPCGYANIEVTCKKTFGFETVVKAIKRSLNENLD